MFVKLIEVQVKPGRLSEYLAAQHVWNHETARDPALLSYFCGQDPQHENEVLLTFTWRSRDAYERWMVSDHDRIAEMAGASELYESLRIRLLDSVESFMLSIPLRWSGDAMAAVDVQFLSEVYRVSAALRVAVRLALFDHLAETTGARVLAEVVSAPEVLIGRLLAILECLRLVDATPSGWRNGPLAARFLVSTSAEFQGDMILHNSGHLQVERWWRLEKSFGLEELPEDPDSRHRRFVRAMANTAAAGQAAVVADAVDLSGCRLLLDVGSAEGHYAVEFCRRHQQLSATVLDLPETGPLAEAAIQKTGLAGRVRFAGGDFRVALPGGFDAMLISNVLRGESSSSIDALLEEAREALQPGGQLIVVDLFPTGGADCQSLSAALFGLHLPSGANLTIDAMVERVRNAGFSIVWSKRLPRSVVSNGLILGRKNPESRK